jgi:uncharacterized protein (TIGR00369 family)
MSEHFSKLERMYLSAPINIFYSPTIQISEGVAIITMHVRPEFFHAARAVHGSVCFKALDDAAFFAVNSLVPECFVLTTSFTIYITRPIIEGVLRAEGKVTSKSSNLFVAEAALFNLPDIQVARGSGTFMRSTIKLNEKIGYK